jgi:hypothetical protein
VLVLLPWQSWQLAFEPDAEAGYVLLKSFRMLLNACAGDWNASMAISPAPASQFENLVFLHVLSIMPLR